MCLAIQVFVLRLDKIPEAFNMAPDTDNEYNQAERRCVLEVWPPLVEPCAA